MIGLGAAMGFSPRDIDQMSMWEFAACADGFLLSKGAKRKGHEMSDERLAELGVEGF